MFDVEGARKAGYSPAEIASFLAQENKFDLNAAKEAGYSDDEIIGHLSGGRMSYTDPSGAVTNDPAVAARWRDEANAKQGAPSLGQQFMRGMGLGVRDAIEGVGQLPGMLYDAARAPGKMLTAGINAMAPRQQTVSGMVTGEPPKPAWQIPEGYSSKDILTGAGDALGLPTAETRGERIRSEMGKNVAGLIPSMGAGAAMQGGGKMSQFIGNALATAPVSQVAGAAGAGLGGGIAQESGAGPLAQFGASLAGGITGAAVPTLAGMAGRGVAALVQPFSQGGREKIVGEALLRNSSDPETLATRLMAGADDDARRLPGAPVTAATAARDPQMLLLESGLRSDVQTAPGVMSPAAALRDVDAQRNAVRLQTIEALQRGEGDAAARGVTVREGLNASEKAMKARTSQMYDAIDQTERFSLKPVADEIVALEGKYFGELSGGMPESLRAVRDDVMALLSKKGDVDWQGLQNLRRRAGEIAGKAAVAQNTTEATVAGRIRELIDNIGGSPEWQAATAQRREVGKALQRNETGINATGRITATDRRGMPMLPDDRVPAVALGSPNATRQTLGAFDKAIADAKAAGLPGEQIAALTAQQEAAKQALRDQFAENLFNASRSTTDIADATGNITRQLSQPQFTRWWEKNRATADVLFDGAERKTLDRLAADFAETSVAGTAKARGSDTAQNLSVGNFIARLTNGTIDPQNPLAQSLGNLGPVASWIVKAPEQAMREMLVQALRDPKFAAQLTQKAGADSLERAVLYWQRSMPERLRDASLEALTREVPRIGLSEPNTGRGPGPRLTGR